MSLTYDFGIELQEECQKQESDVHSVHIGIGGDYDFVISQSVDSLVDVQRRLQ